MDDFIDSEVVDVSSPDEYPVDGDIDLSDFHSGLFESDGEATHQEYFEDPFDVSEVTKWKYESESFCDRIEVNGATSGHLQKCKNAIKPTLEACRRFSGVGPDKVMTPVDYANIWLNRDCYLTFLDEIREKISHPRDHPEVFEIREIFRVWILMMVHGVTAQGLYSNPKWYPQVFDVKISFNRYKYLFNKLGSDLPTIDIFEHDNHLDESKQEKIWGSFEQFNPSIKKMEDLVSKIGSKLILPGNVSITIDDDKRRHTSKSFHNENLQMTGFRGSKYGPVMNGAGIVETGVIASVHFTRHGDGALHSVKALLRHIGYGISVDDNTLLKKFDAEIKLDRGYHIATVIKYLSQLGVRWLGTHSEKINDWPFSSNASEKTQSQELVSRDGAPHAAWATRKFHRVDTHAVCYRNGSGGIGNVHFSDSTLYGLWDLECSLPLGKGKNDIVKDPYEHGSIQETLFKSWNEYVLELTSVQAVCPWFDMQTGFLTGTTNKNTVAAVKFALLANDQYGERVLPLFKILGMNLSRPTEDAISKLDTKKIAKAYRRLGYTSKKTKNEMTRAIVNQIPSDALVFEKIVTWCMAPVKKKRREIVDAFRQGQLAESEINNSISKFISFHSKGLIKVTLLHAVGLLQSKCCPIAAVTPDQIGTLKCLVPAENDDFSYASDARKVQCFFERESLSYPLQTIQAMESILLPDGSTIDDYTEVHWISAFEYKHKSAILTTISKPRQIVSSVCIQGIFDGTI